MEGVLFCWTAGCGTAFAFVGAVELSDGRQDRQSVLWGKLGGGRGAISLRSRGVDGECTVEMKNFRRLIGFEGVAGQVRVE